MRWFFVVKVQVSKVISSSIPHTELAYRLGGGARSGANRFLNLKEVIAIWLAQSRCLSRFQ